MATEIRRLADQTAVATYDIEQMVKEIQSAVAAGVMGMDKFSEEVRRGMLDVQHVGGQLTQIIQQVQALAPRFAMVNEGMQTQATGAEQITQALDAAVGGRAADGGVAAPVDAGDRRSDARRQRSAHGRVALQGDGLTRHGALIEADTRTPLHRPRTRRCSSSSSRSIANGT